MFKKLKNLSFTFSPKALIPAVPAVFFLNKLRKIQEFLFSLGSLVNLNLVFVLSIYYSRKQENYINLKSFTYKKLNCLTVLFCKTTYSELVKELVVLILYIRQKLKVSFNLLS